MMKAWNRFWFESSKPTQMRLFRMAVGLLLFALYMIRALDLNFYFSNSGIFPVEALVGMDQMKYRFSLLELLPGTGWVWFLHSVLLTSLLGLVFGVYPRIAAIIAFVLHISFLHRNMAIIFGVDMIATFFLLSLCLADPQSAPIAARKGLRDWLGSMGFRLAQIQLCVIYAYSGMEKLRGIQWWKGEAIWTVMANAQLARWDFSWIVHFPILIVIATYMTLLWEVYFPVLVWIGKFRYPMLFLGILLHVGIGLVINIPFFAALMIAPYLLFLEDHHAAVVSAKVERLCFWKKITRLQGG